MSYEVVSLGNLSGGMNEVLPPSRIEQNECALLQNMEYLGGNNFPRTRRGTQFLARLDAAFPSQYFGLKLVGEVNSHIMGIHVLAASTEFWGKTPTGSFTSRGTLAYQTSEWSAVEWNEFLIMGGNRQGATVPMKKWTGTGNISDLAGTPPDICVDLCIWNNRVWVVEADGKTVTYSQLGDAEDWTDVDPVSGSGFFTMPEGNDRIVKIIAHRERLIIFRRRSIWQVITSLPNTDPSGWRLELLTAAGGCSSKYTVKPLQNDLIFYDDATGVHSLKAVEYFGDFQLSKLSDQVYVPDFLGGTVTAGVIENKYLIAANTDPHAYLMELNQGRARWSKFIFKQNFGGDSTQSRQIQFIGDGAIIQEASRLFVAFFHYTGSATDEYDLCFWPNQGNRLGSSSSDDIDDDEWVDHYGGPDGTAKFDVKCKTRAWDGGSLIETKQILDAGLAFRLLSTTTGFSSASDLRLSVIFDEGGSPVTFDFSNAATSSLTEHAKRVRLTSVRRFHALQLELSTSKAKLGVLVKDFDARVTHASKSFHDTMAQV